MKLKSGSLDKLHWLVSMWHNCSQLGTKRIPGLSLHVPLSHGMLQLGKLCFNWSGMVCASLFMTVMPQMTADLLHIHCHNCLHILM